MNQNKRNKLISATVTITILLIASGIYFGSKSVRDNTMSVRDNPGLLIFNDIVNVREIYGGSPIAHAFDQILGEQGDVPQKYEDEFVIEYAADELKPIIGIELSKCVQDSLEDDYVYASGAYIRNDERIRLDVGVFQKGYPSYSGKTVIFSIANKEWSEESITSHDGVYNEAAYSRSNINGVAVTACSTTEPDIFSEKIFIAKFEIDHFEYYIEGRGGITESEFTELVVDVIDAY